MAYANCEDCHYYCKGTDTCDYWLVEDQLRGCPPGAGCFRKMTKKEYNMGKAQKWDRVKGRQMWLEGKKDKEIAEVWGVHPDAVGQVRRKIWEKEVKKEETMKKETKTEPVNCHENTTVKPTNLLDAVEIVVAGKTGMAATVTGLAVMALKEGNLQEAQACIAWLIDREGKARRA